MGGITLAQDEPAVAPPDTPAPPPDPDPGPSPRRVRLIFFALMPALLLAALEQMIVATALPKIVGEQHGLEKMSWAVTAYLLASTIGLPLSGNALPVAGWSRFAPRPRAPSSASPSTRAFCSRPRNRWSRIW